MKTRKEVTFQEAYKAVYDGKTIQRNQSRTSR